MGASGNIYFVANHLESDVVILSMMNTISEEIEWSFSMVNNPVKAMTLSSSEETIYLGFAPIGALSSIYLIIIDISEANFK